MVGVMEKYFQIAKCFRDEDLRADRQPEFTQIDLEMSFIEENDVMDLGERLVASIFRSVKGIEIPLPLRRMKYVDAIDLYGSDKPDLRFGMPIEEISSIFANTEISFLKSVLEEKGIINGLVAKNCANEYSRKEIDKLTEYVKTYRAGGLAYLKLEEEMTGSIAKLLSEEEKEQLISTLKLEKNDMVFIISGKKEVVKTSLGALRLKLGRDLNLIDKSKYELLWVVDFPSFEYSEEEKRYVACHHPFTSPKDEDVEKLISDPGNCYSKAYDIVINGYEAGGGNCWCKYACRACGEDKGHCC